MPSAPPARHAPEAATELIPAVDPEGATQLIPPVREAAPDPATTKLRPVPGRPREDVTETRAMPAVSSDFDSLFRSAAATTPQEEEPYRPARRRPAARRSPGAVAAAVVVGCALVGLAAGAALSGGGEDGGGGEPSAPASSAEAGTEDAGAGTAPADEQGGDSAEARAQAAELSALLAESNDSRDAVIGAVADIRSCRRLPQAADSLRAAAEQRNGLLARLENLTVSDIPDGDELAASLRTAWSASAEADTHYAAWADEARQERGVCRGGQARHTDRATRGDRASGRATEAKERAAALWNPVARQHGLPERAAAQL
ncbi:hypothetical protein RM780_00095 [Streptomyces sp. DSM 44917]|uniref:Uncharacterized protein n=1 Tax=Streptomyces boetiae TaxID=3075541 RepID=A0ABU2L1T4_9ACTN|nr:hypothetical protein [Streptomyces sp. DSM 44917]MDT0305366.1 hypothetical protein [Streptomyces sp. DSM 44917]